MAFQERRWKRKEPNIRVVQDPFVGPTLAPVYTSDGYYGGYYGYGYYIAFHEGDPIDIDLATLARGHVKTIMNPAFINRDGAHLIGRMPLVQSAGETNIFDIDLEIEPAFSARIPTSFDAPPILRPRIAVLPVEVETVETVLASEALIEPVEIEVISILEKRLVITEEDEVTVADTSLISRSRLSSPSDVVINEDGTIEWSPKGTYFRDAILVASDVLIRSPRGKKRRIIVGQYQPVIDDTPQRVRKKTLVAMDDNVVGDADEEEKHLNKQLNNGTCAITAVGSMLESTGAVDDGTELLQDGTLVLDTNGNPLNTPTLTDEEGNPPYIVQLTTQDQVDVYNDEGVSGIVPLFRHADEGIDWNPEYTKNPNNAGEGAGFFLADFFGHVGEDYHTGYATDFSTIIRELEAGNAVGMLVDTRILGNSNPIFDQAMSMIDNVDISVRATSNHAVWITEIDFSDPEFPTVTLNDSRFGVPQVVPLLEFIAATKGAGFLYFATGDEKPDIPASRNFEADEAEIFEDVQLWIYMEVNTINEIDDRNFTPDQAEDRGLTTTPESVIREAADVADDVDIEVAYVKLAQTPIIELLQHPDLIPHLPQALQDKINEHKDKVDRERREVYRDLGLTEDEIDHLFELEADIDVLGAPLR